MFPYGKLNGTKNALFFLSRAPIHHSFAFNLRFLYELKHKVCLSKIVCGALHFQFRFVFIKGYIFGQQNMHGLSESLCIIIPFRIKIIERSPTVLLPDLSFLSWNKKF